MILVVVLLAWSEHSPCVARESASPMIHLELFDASRSNPDCKFVGY